MNDKNDTSTNKHDGQYVTDLKNKLNDIDNGRFKPIIEALNVKEVCGKCGYFNLSIKDLGQRYRCRCMGSCIAATLHPDLIEYFNHKLGLIDEYFREDTYGKG